MKRFKFIITTALIIVFAIMCTLSACTLPEGTSTSKKPSGIGSASGSTAGSSGGVNVEPPVEITVSYRNDYTPTRFEKDSVTYEAEQITDGLIMVKNTITKSNSQTTVVYTLEVDLSKVSIVAGTKDNTTDLSALSRELPSKQATAYETATGKTVYAYLNADFFGSAPVNAFVKDGVIVKDGHNDNGNYDYTNTSSDVPASAPMLFGVKGETAQVAPIIGYEGDITDSAIKRELIRAKLTYKIGSETSNKSYNVETEKDSVTSGIVFNTEKVAKTCKAGDYALKVTLGSGYGHMRVAQKIECAQDTQFTPEGNFGYVFVGKDSDAYTEFSTLERKYISYSVTSPDNTWKGYTTILGCRQSLVENGAVATTVTKENTNGAQSSDVPRSAVGVKEDGTVVIFAVESMYYGKKAQENDTHGMNLPELADFMAFYGIKNGANFDGGGSTQLTVNKNGTKTVMVRSSDTGLYELDSSRKVINTIMVASK